MSILADITQAYKGPRREMRHQLSIVTEPRILMLAFLFCLLSFVARMPELAKISHLAGDDPATMRARFGGMFVATVFMAPLMLYGIAALSHLVMKALGGQGTWQGARLALMWAALVTCPLMLLSGIFKVYTPSPVFFVATCVTAVVFLWQWFSCLAEAEFAHTPQEAA